ncbi:MAG: AraC family transcriptional regulator [Pleurocapsa sp. MO_226.B13]|nr:AraC family transcriptional regulator [Pleurocapsa sp. MO_226.B13]
MAESQITVVELENSQKRAICPDSRILLSSEDYQWQGAMLEQHLFPPFEQPEVTAVSNIISIHLGEPIELEYNHDGTSRRQYSRLVSGDICITPENTIFSARWQESAESLVLSLDGDWFKSIALEITGSERIELTNSIGVRDRLISSIALTLRDEVAQGCPAGCMYQEHLLKTLAVHLSTKYEGGNAKLQCCAGGLSRHKQQKAIDYIQNNIERDVKLAEIAKEVSLSQFHFARLFKKSLGISPYQYLLQCRIERAKELLQSPKVLVTEVAKATGFSSSSYFTKQFRQLVGITPKAYQQR